MWGIGRPAAGGAGSVQLPVEHRDLVPAEIPAIRERVRTFFSTLRARYPGRDLTLMTPLAEGADRLVAEEALALGLLALQRPRPA